MTLTEQWKKGELKKNKYWVKYKNGKIDTWELSEGITIESKPEIIEVLAPVPSYQEWQETLRALDAARKAIKMEDKTINRLVNSGKQCNYKNAQLAEENAKLKELLKEYKKRLSEIKNAYVDLTTQDEYGSYYIDEAKLFVEIVGKTIKDYGEPKIDNAIGEKK